MNFDGTIHLGDILILIGMASGVFIVWGRFSVIESKVNTLWKWFSATVMHIKENSE